ncbi:uncharacterized protein BJ171DRAFT_500936 [Polychytrium aggregatum]|uniref:uncharacterized protein n=1 Tax=Polychytrium aggregatum TaxID=110093 RepID=UPI0022FE471D|nr:uncharacterized protein BJ171DRAFT_500936 [Polychytrium aggregatum]KAI9205609.1 hypothetical protein BJ171DRAFT_500936 [Polychytrium aggregatum]
MDEGQADGADVSGRCTGQMHRAAEAGNGGRCGVGKRARLARSSREHRRSLCVAMAMSPQRHRKPWLPFGAREQRLQDGGCGCYLSTMPSRFWLNRRAVLPWVVLRAAPPQQGQQCRPHFEIQVPQTTPLPMPTPIPTPIPAFHVRHGHPRFQSSQASPQDWPQRFRIPAPCESANGTLLAAAWASTIEHGNPWDAQIRSSVENQEQIRRGKPRADRALSHILNISHLTY